MKWAGFFHYGAKHTDINSELKALFVPVRYFSVSGGAKRIVNLNETDDISVVSEFEQARHFKNLTLYLESTKDFEWLDLMEIQIHNLSFAIKFFAMGQVNRTTTHEFFLVSKKATITEPPDKSKHDGKGNRYLQVRLNLPDVELRYGSDNNGAQNIETW